MKRRSLLKNLVSAFIFLLVFTGPVGICAADDSAMTTLTDLAGRKVTLHLPVNRIVLASSRHLHEFAAVGGADVLNKIVGWGSDLKLYDYDTWSVYKEHFPQIAQIPDVGYHYKGTFNLETVIGLNPDVVVFPLWLTDQEGINSDIVRLNKAGIPVVYIDFYKDPFAHPVPSIKLIGKLLGKEKRAAEITDFYEKQVNLVRDRLKTYKGKKTSVYIEVGSKGPDEYGNTYSSSEGLGALVREAGGVDIADPIISKSGPIDPEYLLEANPDVIVISGSYWPSNKKSMRLGYHADEKTSLALLESYTGRKGWDMLQAVQNRKVYSIFHGFSFRIYNFAGIQALAKWFYPDLFSDIDPEANFKLFHETFMPVPYQGKWMIGLDE